MFSRWVFFFFILFCFWPGICLQQMSDCGMVQGTVLAPGQTNPHIRAPKCCWVCMPPFCSPLDLTSGQLNRESSESSWRVMARNRVHTTPLAPLHLQPSEEGVHVPPCPSLPPYGALAGAGGAHPIYPSGSHPASLPTLQAPISIYSINSFPHYVYPFTWLLCFLILLMFIICPTGSTDFASCRA